MSTQGERIREIRRQLNMTQDEFGSIFNATKSYVSLAERDRCNFSVPQMVKLLLDYSVNINYLLGGIGAPFIKKKDDCLKLDILNQIDKILTDRGF